MVRICKDGKKKYKSLGISVNPAHWDFKKNLPKPKCPNYATLLILINEKISEYQRIILERKSITQGLLPQLYSKPQTPYNPSTLYLLETDSRTISKHSKTKRDSDMQECLKCPILLL